MADKRISYGVGCLWWDFINKVGTTGKSRLPCCPHCRGVLFEMDNEKEFFDGARKYEANGHPGYIEQLLWMRGKCFKSMQAANLAYKEAADG